MNRYDPWTGKIVDEHGNSIPSYDPTTNQIIDGQRVAEAAEYSAITNNKELLIDKYTEIELKVNDLNKKVIGIDAQIDVMKENHREDIRDFDDKYGRTTRELRSTQEYIFKCFVLVSVGIIFSIVCIIVAAAILYDNYTQLSDRVENLSSQTISSEVDYAD